MSLKTSEFSSIMNLFDGNRYLVIFTKHTPLASPSKYLDGKILHYAILTLFWEKQPNANRNCFNCNTITTCLFIWVVCASHLTAWLILCTWLLDYSSKNTSTGNFAGAPNPCGMSQNYIILMGEMLTVPHQVRKLWYIWLRFVNLDSF